MYLEFEIPSSPENYYHAVCDYALPYFHFFRSKGLLTASATVTIKTKKPKSFLLFSKIINTLLPNHTLTYSDHAAKEFTALTRMSRGFRYRRTINYLAKHIEDNFDFRYAPSTVVLISRRDAPRHASVADGRPHIRTIENNDELASEIEKLCHMRGIKFLNVYNEDMNFAEQLSLYHGAKCVIGQHGAGLTNIMWMQRSTHCFEIQCSNRLPFFRQIARAKHLHYHEVQPAFANSSMPVNEMIKHEIGRDEIATVAIRDILTPLSKLLQS
jgi:hypothetical protein